MESRDVILSVSMLSGHNCIGLKYRLLITVMADNNLLSMLHAVTTINLGFSYHKVV